MCVNTKNSGGKMIINPLGIINDGLMEVVYFEANSVKPLLKGLDQATKEGGT